MSPPQAHLLAVRLSAANLAVIEAAAEDAYPEECCGLLVGRRGEEGEYLVERIVASPNVAGKFSPLMENADEYRRDHFEVDPRVRLGVMTELEEVGGGRQILGAYHSHPDHPCDPSPRDAAGIYEPALLWIITSVQKGRSGATAAFVPLEDCSGFERLALEII